jgi:hypothetical protein
MELTERDKQVLSEISEWEQKLYRCQGNDLQLTYDKYLEQAFSLLPEQVQEEFFSKIDTWMFHLHSMIQGSQMQQEAQERILSAGRIFDERIAEISDMKRLKIDQLQYIAKRQIALHRLYSFTQGGLAGTGNALFLGTDFLVAAIINLKAVQMIAMTYGNEVQKPFEMMTALKVFYSASLPVRLQGKSWEELFNEWKTAEKQYFFNGSEEVVDHAWFDQPIKQLLKSLAILSFRRKKLQGIPLISIGIGAGLNYRLTKRITDFTHNYYTLRYLLEKENGNGHFGA